MWLAPDEWQAVRFTLLACLLSTALILPFGLAIAWLLARRQWFGKSIVETIVTLPLVMPPVATGLILLKLLGRRGPLGGFIHRQFDFDIIFTWRAVVIAAAVMSFPLLVRSVRVGFQEVNRRYEQMARTLGAGEWRIFFSITLPLASRAVLGGALLAFARAVGEFGATIVVAGNIPGETSTLSLRIYDAMQLGHNATASRLLVVCIVIAFLAVFVADWLLRKRDAK
jgi:molybdate transport system permease protein